MFSVKQMVGLTAFNGLCAALGYSVYFTVKHHIENQSKERINNKIKMREAKVVDSFDIESIKSKQVYCRCWKSGKFPYCDGSHVKHNKETGDNVGPLIIDAKST